MIALVPGRAGSKRLPRKVVKPLGGKPLIAWTLEAALEADVFEAVVVSTDDQEIAEACSSYPVRVIPRPKRFALDSSPDIQWVQHARDYSRDAWKLEWDEFAILRPTSPFRSASTVLRAWKEWAEVGSEYHSLRAIRPVVEHPAKMWRWQPSGQIRALQSPRAFLWNEPTQSLGKVWVQTAGLEMAHTSVLDLQPPSISGSKIYGFLVTGPEALDINDPWDWMLAENLIEKGEA